MIRHGYMDSHPVHSAACALCIAAVYDQPAFEDAARWIRDHLDDAHGVGVVEVDVRRLVNQQSPSWARQAAKVVAQLVACWDDPEATPLVARGRTDRRAA